MKSFNNLEPLNHKETKQRKSIAQRIYQKSGPEMT